MSRKVIIGQFEHETNTYNQCPTELDHFNQRMNLKGDEILSSLADRQLAITGFMDVARDNGWQLIPTVAAAASPGGKVSNAAWKHLAGGILDTIRAHEDIDGICLGLHGAMVTEIYDDAEAALIEMIREVVGPDVPIAVTLDLHGNISEQMCKQTNIMVSYQTYPHVDMRQSGQKAAQLLEQAMSGAIKPTSSMSYRPLLVGANNGRTNDGQMIDLLRRAEQMMLEPGVLHVAINAGFSMADVPCIGPSVIVTGDGKNSLYKDLADQLMDEIWRRRNEFTVIPLAAEKAVKYALNRTYDGKPLVISDYADNPGSGAYGDATYLLRAMLEADVQEATYGAFCDADLAASLCRNKVGTTVTCSIGGKCDAHIGGGALEVTGEIMFTSDGKYVGSAPMSIGELGPTAVLRVNGIDLLIVSFKTQVIDLQMFSAHGINLLAKKTIVVKSKQHFRAAFDAIAGEVIFAESFGLASQDVTSRVYANVRRPIYPLDSMDNY